MKLRLGRERAADDLTALALPPPGLVATGLPLSGACNGTGTLSDAEITSRVREVFDFRLGAIVRDFDLKNLPGKNRMGFYEQLAVYGQMGRTDLDVPWEQSDKADALK